jgi:hypothetical protein
VEAVVVDDLGDAEAQHVDEEVGHAADVPAVRKMSIRGGAMPGRPSAWAVGW